MPVKYRGKQAIVLSEGIFIPLKYKGGLHYIKIRKPTIEELSDYPVQDLTSGAPWDPSIYKNDDSDDYSCETRLIAAQATKPAEPDWEHLQRCLGWKPIEVVKKTLQVTTQYAQNAARLPMRRHYKSRFSTLFVNRS